MPDFQPLIIDPAQVFAENKATHAADEQRFATRHRMVATVRLAVFVGAAVAGYWCFSGGHTLPGFAVIGVAYLAFMALVRWHTRVGYQREHARLLAQLNQEEQQRLTGQLTAFDPGLRYLDAQHPYAADLDVFGPHSLYQLLNRATSRLGQDWLADWLRTGAPADVIRQRQTAVAELAPDLSWQQQWQARARHFPRQDADPRQFTRWLQQPDFFAGKGWLKAALVVLPPVALATVAWWLLGRGSMPMLIALAVLGVINAAYRAARADYVAQSIAIYDALRAYRDQVALFEERQWQAPRLQQLHATLHAARTPASRLIGQLSRIAGLFSIHKIPPVAGLGNALLLWDLAGMWLLENWKKRLAGQLTELLEAGAELEALVSLAGFQFANPGFATPEISPDKLEFTAQELRHPLIFSSRPVANDFSTRGPGQTGVVTGSNMAGKSTFLRTVGLTMVLAQAGAVVAARQLRLSPAQVYTAMRTQDNLAESTSSFYAELKRLRLLLELTATGVPVFYLLDEILKGTNSRDRHRGARALVHQLHRRPASGLISTHDLELAGLAEELPGFVTNYSFNSTIEGDEIRFDYRLTPGLCREFNASKLMQLMGIEVEEM
ncbi:DNA mismatch repair protein MutS [Hymenobacter sp. BT175]|nr:DNA mismatch repair protein MutS [Hymenobacter translucens]